MQVSSLFWEMGAVHGRLAPLVSSPFVNNEEPRENEDALKSSCEVSVGFRFV